MASPTVSDVHLDKILTMMSVAYLQEQGDYVAWQAFPTIPVEKESDRYYVYDKDFWFRNYAKRRAPGTESAGSGYKVSRDGYFCNITALHHDIDDPTRANTDSPLDSDTDATLFVSRGLVLEQEVEWASSYFTTGVWTAPGSDAAPAVLWSDDSSSVISDVKGAKANILKTTGMEPNQLIIPYEVWNRFQVHPEIVDRYKYTTADSITTAMVARLFELDRILVAKSVLNSAVEGAAGNYDFVLGNDALLCYGPRNPGLRQPAAGYTFMWRGVSGGLGENVGIKKFRMEQLASDRVEGQLSYDYKVVGADLGFFWNGVL